MEAVSNIFNKGTEEAKKEHNLLENILAKETVFRQKMLRFTIKLTACFIIKPTLRILNLLIHLTLKFSNCSIHRLKKKVTNLKKKVTNFA